MNTVHSQRKMTLHRRAWTLAGSFLLAIAGCMSIQAQEPKAESEATTKAEASPPPPTLAGEERDMKLLAAQLPEESAIWLSSDSENFLSIYEPDRTGSPFGVLLIIHDEGQHANWPHNIEAIRNTMPEYGWGSLTLSLPLPDYPGLPAREADVVAVTASQDELAKGSEEPETKAESKPADESKDIYNAETGKVDNIDQAPSTKGPEEAPQTPPKAPAEDRAQERITAAIRWLNEQGQYNIAILGDGIGAIRASNFIAQVNEQNAASGKINIIRGMVMLSPKHSTPSGEASLMTYFEQAPMPTLDIYFGYQQHTLSAAQKRLHMARRAKFPQYQQLHLPETVSLPTVNRFNTGNRQVGANRLTQRIRGFLQKYARGVAVDNALIQGRQ